MDESDEEYIFNPRVYLGESAENEIVESDNSESDDSDDEILEGSLVHFGGYEYEFVDDVSPSQKCTVCLLPMRDAVQTKNCGHRFCKTCLERSLSSGNVFCPNGRCQITGTKGFYDDKAFAREILCLRVKCKQEEMGCDWIGQVAKAEQHQTECPYEKEDCNACGEKVQRRLKETHMETDCPQRIVECDYCDDEFPFSSKEDHNENYCKRFPLSCTNNCGKDAIPRELLKSHLDHKCPMTEVVCPYSEAGCPFQDMRVYLNDHLEASMENHLQMTWSTFETTKMKLECTRMELNGVKLKLNSLEDLRLTSQTFMSFIAESRDRNRSLEERIKVLEEKKATRRKKSEKNEDWRETRADVVSYRQYCTPSKEKCDYDDLFD